MPSTVTSTIDIFSNLSVMMPRSGECSSLLSSDSLSLSFPFLVLPLVEQYNMIGQNFLLI